MIYFTSDLHFGHDKLFLYGPRGFTNIQEHDETIIKNWNSIVTPDDIVYVLGDLMLNDNAHGVECVNKLNGHLKVILGNHDTIERTSIYEGEQLKNVEVLGYAVPLRYKKFNFFLSHYPTITNNYDSDKLYKIVVNLCGHTHTNNRFVDADKGMIYHCELDAHNNKPVSIEEVIDECRELVINLRKAQI